MTDIERRHSAAVPELLAIIICDEVIRDAETNKFSLIGIFNRIQARAFPVTHPRLHVFISLTNGHGQAPAELRLVCQETENVIAHLEGSVTFPDPLAVVELNFRLNDLRFPRPGVYSFDFYCHGEPVGSRRFEVVSERAAPHAK